MAKKRHSEKTNADNDSQSQIDFETALAEVEEVVEQLESGELGLSDSLARYERGIEKIKLCHEVLQQAEKRIAVLTGVQEDGTAMLEPVETGEEAQDALGEGNRPSRRRSPKKAVPPVSDVDDSKGLF